MFGWGMSGNRIERELRTITVMVGIYCDAHHEREDATLCAECREFLNYAGRRLDKCPYGLGKPTCANCPIHCYKPARKARAREIMRFAGPRMMRRHPLLAIAHLLDGSRKARHPLESTREERLRDRNR